jgi:hypothetical protein
LLPLYISSIDRGDYPFSLSFAKWRLSRVEITHPTPPSHREGIKSTKKIPLMTVKSIKGSFSLISAF